MHKDWMFSKILKNIDLHANVALIGPRNSGKSSMLFAAAEQTLKEGKTVCVFDSATDHRDKSVIYKLLDQYPDAFLCKGDELSILDFDNNKIPFCEQYPYLEIKNHINNKLLLFDVSFFLEQSYFYEDMEERLSVRLLYLLWTRQFLLLLRQLDLHPALIVMDEIELIPLLSDEITLLSEKGSSFLCALHDEKYMESFKSMFTIFHLNKVYGNNSDQG